MRSVDALAFAGALAAASSVAAAPHHYRNVTAGGELRPGVYGRIETRGSPPPPVIFRDPVVGAQTLVAAGTRPVYFYVPPGQVRKWAQSCRKWHACDLPVLFVRMDASPSRLGSWKRLKDAYALHGAQ